MAHTAAPCSHARARTRRNDPCSTHLAPSLGDSNYYRQLTASLLYYQNWELAGQGQEYGAASATASPLQHIWSMSVQGQFYVVIILVASVLVLLRRRGVGARVAGPVLVVVTAASFAYAWYLHHAAQALNYYSTFSRMWELTGGACLALYAPAWRERLTQSIQAWAAGVGLFMVLSTGVLLDGASVFPGPATLYPVIGTALLIVGGGPVARALASRFPRWLGQIAYPLYMWHWPLLIVGTSISGNESPSILLGCVVVGASLVLADLTHRLVERPLQQKARRPNGEENRFATAWAQLKISAPAQARAGAGVVVVGLCALVLVAPHAHMQRVQALSDNDFDPTFYPAPARSPRTPTFPKCPTARPLPARRQLLARLGRWLLLHFRRPGQRATPGPAPRPGLPLR
nr:acyltransferase [Corynebacterium renale]